MSRTTCKADRGIHQLQGISNSQIETLVSGLKSLPRDRATRSLMRECRLWRKRNGYLAPTKRQMYGCKVSQQDGMTNEKLIVATV